MLYTTGAYGKGTYQAFAHVGWTGAAAMWCVMVRADSQCTLNILCWIGKDFIKTVLQQQQIITAQQFRQATKEMASCRSLTSRADEQLYMQINVVFSCCQLKFNPEFLAWAQSWLQCTMQAVRHFVLFCTSMCIVWSRSRLNGI